MMAGVPASNRSFDSSIAAFQAQCWPEGQPGSLPIGLQLPRIAPQAQQKEGATLFDVEIELNPAKEITLRAGYSANADLIIREKKDVVTIPERLVIFEDGGKKTFVERPGDHQTPPLFHPRQGATAIRGRQGQDDLGVAGQVDGLAPAATVGDGDPTQLDVVLG